LVDLLIDGPPDAEMTVALAHGAGVGFDAPFMKIVATGLAERDVRVVRFEFDYMAKRRLDGKRRPPDRPDRLMACWREVVTEIETERLVVAGKSMGGRIASMIADDVGAAGLVCLGYPFHPAGKPDRLRIDHLGAIRTPTLILQGERDALGAKAEVEGYPLADSIRIVWLADGDHGFRPQKSTGRTEAENLEGAISAMAAFVLGLDPR
jgi:predicted alpha/beta-hydrolase family hydrolase